MLPVVADALWGFTSDQLPDLGSAAELGIAGAFILVFGAMGVYLVARLVDAGIRTFRGAADLGEPVVEEGVVVAVGAGERAGYVAVDDGRHPETRAWRRPIEIPAVARGADVRVTSTRHLRYVTRVDRLPS